MRSVMPMRAIIPSFPSNASACTWAASHAGFALSISLLPALVKATGLLRPSAPSGTSSIHPSERAVFRSRVNVDLFKCSRRATSARVIGSLRQIAMSKANCGEFIPNGRSLSSQMAVTAFDSRRARLKMNSGTTSPHDNAQLHLAYLPSDTPEN